MESTPKQKKNTLAAFMLPTTLLNELREAADKYGEPQSLIVRQAIRQKLDSLNKQKGVVQI